MINEEQTVLWPKLFQFIDCTHKFNFMVKFSSSVVRNTGNCGITGGCKINMSTKNKLLLGEDLYI